MTFGDPNTPFGTAVFGAVARDGVGAGDLVQTLRTAVRALHGYAAVNEKFTHSVLKNQELLRTNVETIATLLKLGKIDEAKAFVKIAIENWPDLPQAATLPPLDPLWCFLGGGS